MSHPMLVYNIGFALMVAGVVLSKIAIHKMRVEIERGVPTEQRPKMKWWNFGRLFKMIRVYRTIPNRGNWSEIYIASAIAVMAPLAAIFAWAGIVSHK